MGFTTGLVAPADCGGVADAEQIPLFFCLSISKVRTILLY